MRCLKFLLVALLTFGTVNKAVGSAVGHHHAETQTPVDNTNRVSTEPVRSSAEEYAEAQRRKEEQFKDWFSTNLQRIKNNPNNYTQTQIEIPSEESKKRAHSYVYRITGKYQYDCARAICAIALVSSLYSHYSQSCALPMITQGNYSHSIGESSNCKITPDVFPVFYAIAGGSMTGAFNSGLNYYNANWLNLKPYAFLVSAYLITTLVYNSRYT